MIRLMLAENLGRWSQPALVPVSFLGRKTSGDWQPSSRNTWSKTEANQKPSLFSPGKEDVCLWPEGLLPCSVQHRATSSLHSPLGWGQSTTTRASLSQPPRQQQPWAPNAFLTGTSRNILRVDAWRVCFVFLSQMRKTEPEKSRILFGQCFCWGLSPGVQQVTGVGHILSSGAWAAIGAIGQNLVVRVKVRQRDASGCRRETDQSQGYRHGVRHSDTGTKPHSPGWTGARKAFQRSGLLLGTLPQYVNNVRSSH